MPTKGTIDMRTLLAIPALCLALNASAGCPVDHPRDMPELPDGLTASSTAMHKAQLAAENYMWQAETYLACDLMNRRQHNALLTQLEKFTESYNEELIEYQVRSNMIAEN